ncbi:hypothetical protein J2TS6_62530 [Paenibacillus albilobatus]|uniref:AlgX/AlgJ SGNH hydrolase-like domain-containing protein n=1 Tax=Paenibacillus albilobatus TaxID=2716884 RepID=A0A920CFX3_9BACL|nr:hypothetical protein [Paenibacillus albilobatus]GIO35112.1 hypothetical protein J2TS6_62530 [Paenibacillus albilobatus]
MKSYRVYNILIIIFFILAISAPLVAVNRIPGKISIAENRTLANFPSLKNDNKINTKFNVEFENWLSDNLGFRDEMVKTNTKIQYKLFGKLTKNDTLLGKNNWLYYVTPDILKDYQHLNLPSESQLSQWGNSLEKINNYLGKKNIKFIMMLNLDKKTIYPENYPNTINKVGEFSRTDLLVNYLTNNTNINFFTPYEVLMNAKKSQTVYSPRFDNGHWNNFGAFIGYTELMNRVKTLLPNVNQLSMDDFNVTSYKREMKIYNAISFSEDDYNFDLKKSPSATQTKGILDNFNLVNNNVAYTFENSNKDLPKALIFGDSYFYGFLIPQFAESFSEFTFVHTDNIDKLESIVNYVNPDIVIYENVERMFDHTMNILSNTTESYEDYTEFKNLPIINNPTIWLDYCNNVPLNEQDKIIINGSNKSVNLVGWAIDSKIKENAYNIFLKIGDKYFPGNYGIERQSVAEYFGSSRVLKSGFNFNINADDLRKAGKFSFVIISKDKTYQYESNEYQVVIE